MSVALPIERVFTGNVDSVDFVDRNIDFETIDQLLGARADRRTGARLLATRP